MKIKMGRRQGRPPVEVVERLMRRVLMGSKGECWRWLGCQSAGYGRVRCRGRVAGVHRLVYAAFVGVIPARMDVHHKCGNSLCVNPRHLALLRRADNANAEPDRRYAHRARHKCRTLAHCTCGQRGGDE